MTTAKKAGAGGKPVRPAPQSSTGKEVVRLDGTEAEDETNDPSDEPIRIPSDVPFIYADQVMDVVYGMHTTKLVLSQETGAGLKNLRPTGVVTIPTATLLLAAQAIVRDLTSREMVQETAERFASVLQLMNDTPGPGPKTAKSKKSE